VSVGGEPGRYSKVKRLLAWDLGDGWADLSCAWADLQPDPAEAAAALLSAIALRHAAQTARSAAEEFMRGVDEAALVRASASVKGRSRYSAAV
jgi:hypothetical protein